MEHSSFQTCFVNTTAFAFNHYAEINHFPLWPCTKFHISGPSDHKIYVSMRSLNNPSSWPHPTYPTQSTAKTEHVGSAENPEWLLLRNALRHNADLLGGGGPHASHRLLDSNHSLIRRFARIVRGPRATHLTRATHQTRSRHLWTQQKIPQGQPRKVLARGQQSRENWQAVHEKNGINSQNSI